MLDIPLEAGLQLENDTGPALEDGETGVTS
jgi:hypothetical protein